MGSGFSLLFCSLNQISSRLLRFPFSFKLLQLTFILNCQHKIYLEIKLKRIKNNMALFRVQVFYVIHYHYSNTLILKVISKECKALLYPWDKKAQHCTTLQVKLSLRSIMHRGLRQRSWNVDKMSALFKTSPCACCSYIWNKKLSPSKEFVCVPHFIFWWVEIDCTFSTKLCVKMSV